MCCGADKPLLRPEIRESGSKWMSCQRVTHSADGAPGEKQKRGLLKNGQWGIMDINRYGQ